MERLNRSAPTIDRATDQISSSHRGFLTELEPTLKDLPAQLLQFARQQTNLLAQLAKVGAGLNVGLAQYGLRAPAKQSGWKFWQK